MRHGLGAGHHLHDAGRQARRFGRDIDDPRVRARAAHDHQVQILRRPEVIGIATTARHETLIFAACKGLSDLARLAIQLVFE